MVASPTSGPGDPECGAARDIPDASPRSGATPGDAVPEGGGMAAVLARAQAAVADLAKDYSTWALADLTRARQALTQAEGDAGARAAHVEALFRVAHDLKGQGSSFGYPLITRIGDSLCRLTRDRERHYETRHLDLAKSHLDAMQLVLSKEIKGEGGKVGAELVAKLKNLVDAAVG